MSCSLLRHTLFVFALLVFSAVGVGQTIDEPEKQQEFIEDPFAEIGGQPIPLTQEPENPFALPGDSLEAVEKPETIIPAETTIESVGEKIGPIALPLENLEDAEAVQPKSSEPPTDKGDTEQPTIPAQATFEDKFWEYLQSNAYENWAPAPGQDSDFYEGSSPHGSFLKMYLNRTAAAASDDLPNGSIIVKENYSQADPKDLKAITVMYRSKGYNPEGGDWYWIKYNPDGTVATTSNEVDAKKIFGKVNNCLNCHQQAKGNDFTFFNDK